MGNFHFFYTLKKLVYDNAIVGVLSSHYSYVEVLTSNVTAFGNRAYKEILKIKYSHKNGTLIQQDSCPYKRRHQRVNSLSLSLPPTISLSLSVNVCACVCVCVCACAHACAWPEERPCEGRVRRQPSVSQKESSHQKLAF